MSSQSFGELGDEVHGDATPRTFRDRKRLEQAKGMKVAILHALASIAGLYILLDITRHLRPEVGKGQGSIHDIPAGMPSDWRVMMLVKKRKPEGLWDYKASLLKPEKIVMKGVA